MVSVWALDQLKWLVTCSLDWKSSLVFLLLVGFNHGFVQRDDYQAEDVASHTLSKMAESDVVRNISLES